MISANIEYLDDAAGWVIVVREGKQKWKWIWGIGLLHDHILHESGYPTLYARYRNQKGMLPRIEFHGSADLYTALTLLLEETSLEKDDVINLESETGGRWMSIGEYFADWDLIFPNLHWRSTDEEYLADRWTLTLLQTHPALTSRPFDRKPASKHS